MLRLLVPKLFLSISLLPDIYVFILMKRRVALIVKEVICVHIKIACSEALRAMMDGC